MTAKKELVLKRTDSLDKRTDALFGFPTPAVHIKKRPGAGGMTFTYVDIAYVIGMLNSAFGFYWEWKITDKGIGERQIWVQGELIIKDPNSGLTITKTGFGGADIKMFRDTTKAVNIGNDLKAASTLALRKAASLLGIGSDVMYGEIEQYTQMETQVEPVKDEAVEADQRIRLMKRMFALTAQKGFSEEDINKVIKSRYKLDSKRELSLDQLRELNTSLEAKPDRDPLAVPQDIPVTVINIDKVVEGTPVIDTEFMEDPKAEENTESLSDEEIFDIAKEDTLCLFDKCTSGENGTRGIRVDGEFWCNSGKCKQAYTDELEEKQSAKKGAGLGYRAA